MGHCFAHGRFDGVRCDECTNPGSRDRLDAAERRARKAEAREATLREAVEQFSREAVLSLVRPGRLAEWKARFAALSGEGTEDTLFVSKDHSGEGPEATDV